jgi:hypothetical protein
MTARWAPRTRDAVGVSRYEPALPPDERENLVHTEAVALTPA